MDEPEGEYEKFRAWAKQTAKSNVEVQNLKAIKKEKERIEKV